MFNAVLLDYGVKINQRIEVTICDNEWHTLSVIMGTAHSVVQLDDIRKEISEKIPKEAIEVIRSLPVHVGGLSGSNFTR